MTCFYNRKIRKSRRNKGTKLKPEAKKHPNLTEIGNWKIDMMEENINFHRRKKDEKKIRSRQFFFLVFHNIFI